MGAVHSRGRFQCTGCWQVFTWRSEYREHILGCPHFKGRKSIRQGKCAYLASCFICGSTLSGAASEEAAYVEGCQKLYHSRRTLVKVLEIVLEVSSLTPYTNYTLGLCSSCMNAINEWDKTDVQQTQMAKDLASAYRLSRTKKSVPVESVYRIRKKKKKAKEDENENFEALRDLVDNETSLLTPLDDQGLHLLEGEDKFNGCEEKQYHCECGKVVEGLDAFVDHQLRSGCKLKTNEFPCKYCDTLFTEKKVLIAHQKECVESTLINGAHECDICGRRFLVRGRVDTHKRQVHGIGTTDHQLCSYCGRTFGQGYNMKNHLAKEHGVGKIDEVVCELCGNKFADRSSLRNHRKNVHSERKYECQVCGKKFATVSLRNHHVNEVHNQTFCYECKICNQQFSIGFKYRYHMRKMHNTLQFPCSECGRSFTSRSDLNRHIRGVHRGIREPKKFPCRICGRLFPSTYKVKRHMSSHGQLMPTVATGETQTVFVSISDNGTIAEGTVVGAAEETATLRVPQEYQSAQLVGAEGEVLEESSVGGISMSATLEASAIAPNQMIIIQEPLPGRSHQEFLAPQAQVVQTSPGVGGTSQVVAGSQNMVATVPNTQVQGHAGGTIHYQYFPTPTWMAGLGH